MARTLAALHAGFAAYKPEHCARLRRNWQNPAFRLKRGITLNETLRKRDMKKVLAREPGCDWDWYYKRQGKRRARIDELRVKAETAALNERIASELFGGKRSK